MPERGKMRCIEAEDIFPQLSKGKVVLYIIPYLGTEEICEMLCAGTEDAEAALFLEREFHREEEAMRFVEDFKKEAAERGVDISWLEIFLYNDGRGRELEAQCPL